MSYQAVKIEVKMELTLTLTENNNGSLSSDIEKLIEKEQRETMKRSKAIKNREKEEF